MIRLARLLADARYNFMTRVPQFADPLSRFLRLLLGIDQGPSVTGGGDSAPWAESYASRKPHPEAPHSQVTVLDLSLVATDVIENVTALIGRILLDFFVRLEPRASLPTVLVLEEAHRYVSLNESRSRSVFERIAKEGRKFGLGLIVASQRPSELSPTLLAQCGTLVAHRTVNPIDQDLVRGATPAASRDVLRQLPGLATQHAVVMGESVPVPAHVRIRDVHERPRSADPAFIQLWRTPPDEDVVERVARPWESPGLEDATEEGTAQNPQIDSS